MSPVVAATACMPRRKANASTGLILKMNGSISANRQMSLFEGFRPHEEFRCLGFRLKQAFGYGIELAAGFGERDASRGAQEQLNAVRFLKFPHVIGNCRLGQGKPDGGLGETAVLGHRMERLKLGISHIRNSYGLHKNIRFD